MSKESILVRFYEVLKNPYAGAERWQQGFKGAIGYYLPFIPEELTHAAGFLPLALLNYDEGDTVIEESTYIPGFAYSYMKKINSYVESDQLKHLTGVIMPIICDTNNILAEQWKNESRFNFCEVFRVPRKTNGSGVKEYLRGEIKRLQTVIEQISGKTITEDDLQNSIEIYQQNRKVLRDLYAFHSTHPTILTPRELLSIIKCSFIMPKEKHTRWSEELLFLLKQQTTAQSNEEHIRLFCVGKLWEPPELMEIISNSKGVIVGDNFYTGSSFLVEQEYSRKDPYETIMDRLFDEMKLFSGCLSPGKEREDAILDLVLKTSTQGVIFFQIKFCELLSFDYPDLNKRLKQMNIPTLAIETDLYGISVERIKTQIETFLEIVRGL